MLSSADYKRDNSAVYRIDLTLDEQIALLRHLPSCFSLQQETRAKKQSGKHQKRRLESQEISVQSVHAIADKSTKQKAEGGGLLKTGSFSGVSELMKPCQKVLGLLMTYKNAWPFLEPVQAVALGIPEYQEIIKEPMDLSTVSHKMDEGIYLTPQQFHLDILKIVNNSFQFNDANEDFLKITADFERYYFKIMADHKIPFEKLQVKPKSSKKKKRLPGVREANETEPLSLEDKLELADTVRRLAKEHLRELRLILDEPNQEVKQVNLEKLSPKKWMELQKFVRGKIEESRSLRRCLQNEEKNVDELQSEITEKWIEDSQEV